MTTATYQITTLLDAIFHSRSVTSVMTWSDTFVSFHILWWLKAQMTENVASLELRAWNDLQSVSESDEMKDYARRMLNEEDVVHTISDDESNEKIDDNFSNDLQFLLNNDWFKFEEENMSNASEIFINSSLKKMTVSDLVMFNILRSCLRNSDSEIDSDEFVDFLKIHASSELRHLHNNIIAVFINHFKFEIFNFVLEMTMWCKTKEITRLNYFFLRQVLCLSEMSEIKQLSLTLSTLLIWEWNWLFISFLQKVKILIKVDKMSFNTFKSTVNMYHFNSCILIVMLLSTWNIKKKMHFEMINIVKSFSQLWHAEC